MWVRFILLQILLLTNLSCNRKVEPLVDIDFKPTNEHEWSLLEEKRRAIKAGLSVGAWWRSWMGPRIELIEIRLEQGEDVLPLLERISPSNLGCIAPLRSQHALLVRDALQKIGLTCVAPTATSVQLSKEPQFFMMSPDDHVIGRALGAYVTQKLGSKRIAVLTSDSVDLQLSATIDGFLDGAKSASVSKIFRSGDGDPIENFHSIRQLAQEGFDSIFIGLNFSDALAPLEELNLSAAKQLVVVGLESWNNAAFLEQVSGTKVQIFVPQFFRRVGSLNKDSVVYTATRDAVSLILKTKGNPAELRVFDGTTGQMNCNGKSCWGTMNLFEVKEGKLGFVDPIHLNEFF